MRRSHRLPLYHSDRVHGARESLVAVERAPDPADRRAKLVRLTARGRAVEETVRDVIREIEDEWAQGLGEENYQTLTHLLRALIALLGE